MLSLLKSAVRKASIGLLRRSRLSASLFSLVLARLPFRRVAGRLYVWTAQARADAGDLETAIALCDRAAVRAPALAAAFFCRGRLRIARGDWSGGAEDLRRAVRRMAPEGSPRPATERFREPLLCCYETLGQVLVSEGRPEEALEHLKAAAALRPDHGPLFLLRGQCHHALGRTEAALSDYRRALGSGLNASETVFAHQAMGRLLAREGRVDEAVEHYHAGLPPAADPTDETAALARRMRAYDTLAEDVVNWYGELDTARRVYRAKLDVQRRLSPPDALDDLILSDDWVRNIGHMGAVDSVLKLNQLGWRSWRSITLLAPPAGTANRHYLNCLRDHLTVVTDPARCDALAPRAAAYGFRVAHGLHTPDSDILYFFEALGLIQREWEALGRPPLLMLPDADVEHGRAALERLGMPRDAWFVCLHVRESGFHESGGSRHQAHRNADVLDYLPAIRAVTERGGWVVRMGDPSMTPLPEMERVLDYAHAPAKSDRMDVFLCGRCRFFVGLASGLSQAAVGFGVPCVYVNWISNVLPPFSAKDVFTPKLFRAADGRLLSFAEMYDPKNLYRNASYYLIREAGLEFNNSDADDIRGAVTEMMDQLDDGCVYTPDDLRLREWFDDVMGRFGHRGYCRLSRDFLRKHRGLLTAAEFKSGAA